MQIQFKGTNYELSPQMTEHASRKLQGLGKYLGKGSHTAQAYIDLGKETQSHANGRIWYAEANLNVEGQRYTAKAMDETLGAAIDAMTTELGSELRGAKKKQESLLRRGGAQVKFFLRGFSH